MLGYIDTNGELVIPFNYYYSEPVSNIYNQSYVYAFTDGMSVVQNQDRLYGAIDTSGNAAVPFKYHQLSDFSGGFAAARLGDKWGFVDKSGNEAAPFIFDAVRVYNHNGVMASVRIGGKWGCIALEPRGVIGELHTTDIQVTVNGVPIPSYGIDGKTAIIVEDLKHYGFDVSFNQSAASLNAELPPNGYAAKGLPIAERQANVKVGNIIHSDIVTFIDGVLVPSFATNGKMCVLVDDLNSFVPSISCKSDAENRIMAIETGSKSD
jgi:hypothetical protein